VETVANDIVPAARRATAKRCLLASPVLAVAGVTIGLWSDNVSYYGAMQRVETCNGMTPEPGWVLPMAVLAAAMSVAAVTATLAGRVLLRPGARATRADLPLVGVVAGVAVVGWAPGPGPWVASVTTDAALVLAAATVVAIVLTGAAVTAMRMRSPSAVRRRSSWLVPATLTVGLLAVLFTMLMLSGVYGEAPMTAARLCNG
jgi:hypothetical protein